MSQHKRNQNRENGKAKRQYPSKKGFQMWPVPRKRKGGRVLILMENRNRETIEPLPGMTDQINSTSKKEANCAPQIGKSDWNDSSQM